MEQTGPDELAASADGLPPGQHEAKDWPVLHYGPVPRFRPQSWDLRVFGATEAGADHRWTWDAFCQLPRISVEADLHCVTKFSLTGGSWQGVATSEIVEQVPPAPDTTHVMVWAEYGYSANLRLADFLAADAILASHRNERPLTAEHGFPLRLVVPHLYAWKGPKWVRGIEYLTGNRRGFWEERGYHNVGEVWTEQRYAWQEEPDPNGPARVRPQLPRQAR